MVSAEEQLEELRAAYRVIEEQHADTSDNIDLENLSELPGIAFLSLSPVLNARVSMWEIYLAELARYVPDFEGDKRIVKTFHNWASEFLEIAQNELEAWTTAKNKKTDEG